MSSSNTDHRCRLVNYNSQEGELVYNVIQNKDLTNLVESYLFNDAYLRVTLPDNLSQNSRDYYNKNTILDFKDFENFYIFYDEKTKAKSESTTSEITNCVNTCVQKLLKRMETEEFTMLDYYTDYRFNRICLRMLYLKPVGSGSDKKVMFKEIDLSGDHTVASRSV